MLVPEAAGHELGRPSLRPVDVEPESLFDPGVDCRASFVQVRQLQSHHTCRRPETRGYRGDYTGSAVSSAV